MADAVPSGTAPHKGWTLLDLFVAVSGAWAFPVACLATLGRGNLWFILASLGGGVFGVFWAWHFRKLGRVLYRLLVRRAGTDPSSISMAAGHAAFLAELVLSVSLQYALYRGLVAALAWVTHA